MVRFSKKMADEIQRVKYTLRLAQTTFGECQKEERKSLVSIGHSGTMEKRVVACMSLVQRQKGRSTTKGADLSFLAKY